MASESQARGCILSKFYIKPQPPQAGAALAVGCILSKFYIKPQRETSTINARSVVSYRNSTSNHNSAFAIKSATPLYLIEILHQTTTPIAPFLKSSELYLIEILHQTTTYRLVVPCGHWLYLIEILHQTTTEKRLFFKG